MICFISFWEIKPDNEQMYLVLTEEQYGGLLNNKVKLFESKKEALEYRWDLDVDSIIIEIFNNKIIG